MTTKRTPRTPRAMLTLLEQQFLAEYERELQASIEAAGRGRITQGTHSYNERYYLTLLIGQNDAIRRLRAMLDGQEREEAVS